jgi:hypothetical protein
MVKPGRASFSNQDETGSLALQWRSDCDQFRRSRSSAVERAKRRCDRHILALWRGSTVGYMYSTLLEYGNAPMVPGTPHVVVEMGIPSKVPRASNHRKSKVDQGHFSLCSTLDSTLSLHSHLLILNL